MNTIDEDILKNLEEQKSDACYWEYLMGKNKEERPQKKSLEDAKN